ncbi:MAG: formylglycine-generating enzyme family protein [Nitrospirae bacterium]|nr:formylglycine-generating enzyme family protein [Candidatus Manganitrophaceae bacterium]
MRTIGSIVFLVIISIFSSLSFLKSEPLTSSPQSAHQEKSKVLLEGKCLHCHGGRGALQQDVSQPECQECHGVPTLPSEPVFIEMPEPSEIIQQKLVHIPAGSYVMGSPGRPAAEGRGNADEGPPHEVMVDDFYIDRYETTNAHFREYLEATGAKPPLLWRGGVFPKGITNHPVVYVSWHDADAFCSWAGKRLPNEKEWEKAARGDDRRNFPWGVQFDYTKANTPQYWLAQGIEVYKGTTMPVGSFETGKSPYGLYDMAGNVYEWVNNWYMPYPGNQEPNVHYGKRNKVLRGGSWYDCMSYGCGLSAPVYNRSRFTPEIRNKGFGFRCASDTLHPEKNKQKPEKNKQKEEQQQRS